MRDLTAELKELRLYGMASAWEEVAADANGVLGRRVGGKARLLV